MKTLLETILSSTGTGKYAIITTDIKGTHDVDAYYSWFNEEEVISIRSNKWHKTTCIVNNMHCVIYWADDAEDVFYYFEEEKKVRKINWACVIVPPNDVASSIERLTKDFDVVLNECPTIPEFTKFKTDLNKIK